MMKMNFLTIDKVNKIIELAKLVYGAKTPQSVSDMKLTDSNPAFLTLLMKRRVMSNK